MSKRKKIEQDDFEKKERLEKRIQNIDFPNE